MEISNLARQTILDLKAVLTVVKKAGAIPAPPEEAVEVLNRNSFFHSFFLILSLKAELIIQVAYYSGAENPVIYTRIFKNTFACVFNLKKYPFDTQVE